jgi:hypothetical protein
MTGGLQADGSGRGPDCLKCVHFKVSWDPAFPNSCLVFGIKSRSLPQAEVFRATGTRCPVFRLNEKLKGSSGN